MLGILYRSYRECVTSTSEVSKKASFYRSRGRFLDAQRVESTTDRLFNVVFGSLAIKAGDQLLKICSDLFDADVESENDARVAYIVSKLVKAENHLASKLEETIPMAIGCINQATKALLLFPPFKEPLIKTA
jgi:hypothetical protein